MDDTLLPQRGLVNKPKKVENWQNWVRLGLMTVVLGKGTGGKYLCRWIKPRNVGVFRGGKKDDMRKTNGSKEGVSLEPPIP